MMDEQYKMFGGLPPHQKHSETSKAAAISILGRVGPLQRRILNLLQTRASGYTDEEMQDILDMPANTQRPRRIELVEKRLVRDSDGKRRTKSGRLAVVWVAVR